MEENNNEPVKRIDITTEENKVISWIKRNNSTIYLIILSLFFVFNGMVKIIQNKESNWWELLGSIGASLVFGVVITSLVADSGYTAGKESEEYKATRETAVELCQKALPYKKEAELYVSNKIDNDIKAERIEILSKASISYDEIFNVFNIPYDYKVLRKKYSHKQCKAIRQAIRIKKIPFALFGFASVKTVGRKAAPSENKRRSKMFISKLMVKVFIAVLSGSVMFSFIGVSIESVLYSIFQLLLWFGSGVMGRIQNKNFIMNDVREYDQERIWYLEEFLALPKEEIEKLSLEISTAESKEDGIKRLTMSIDNSTENDNINKG